jgi:hypothetical protein
MIQWVIFALICVGIAAFCCWFAHNPKKGDDGISGDWRNWGFDDDPLSPKPKPEKDREKVLT